MAFRMPPPLDSISPDPQAFLIEVVRRFKQPFVDTINRTSTRLKRPTFDVFSGGEVGRGPPVATIPLQATTATPDVVVALQFCSLALLNAGVLFDEARRVSLGQPHGLEDDEECGGGRFPTQRELALFGIDDAVIGGFLALMTALAPVLIIIIPLVLPGLISLVESAFPAFLGKPGTEASVTVSANASPGALDALSDPIVLGGLVLVLFFALR